MDELGRIGFSEGQADLLEVATNFCREHSPIDRVRALMDDELGHDPGVWKQIAELGWLGVAIPENHGGSGLGLAEVVPIVEAMGRHMMQTPYVSTVLGAEILRVAGNDDQQRNWLPKIATGTVATLALAETGGFAPEAIETELNDGRLTGVKRLVTDANAADLMIVSARSAGNAVLCVIESAALPKGSMRREKIVDETKRSYEITFDDGNLSDHDIALPALQARGLTARFFVLTGRIGQAGSLDADHIRTLQAAGMAIGSHGVDHVVWAKLDAAALEHELASSKAALEAICGHEITEAGIPFGRYHRGVLKHLRRAGYRTAWSSYRGWFSERDFPRPRTSIQGDMTEDEVDAALKGRLSPYRRARRALGLARSNLLPRG